MSEDTVIGKSKEESRDTFCLPVFYYIVFPKSLNSIK
jgi:hypothetical protein